MYADQQLAPSSWAKALAWAVSLESARARAADAEAAAAAALSTSSAVTGRPSAAAAESSSEDVPLAQQKHAQASGSKSANQGAGKSPGELHMKPAGKGAQAAAANGKLRCVCCLQVRMFPHANVRLWVSLAIIAKSAIGGTHCHSLSCRRSVSASSASGSFLLPDRQPLSPLHAPASTGSAASITQPLSLLTGLATRLLGLGQPFAAAAVPQSSADIATPHSPAGGSNGKELASHSASAAADGTAAEDRLEAASSVLSLTEAGKQHIGQLVVSEVSPSHYDSLPCTTAASCSRVLASTSWKASCFYLWPSTISGRGNRYGC